jgi:hypothetical protein
MCVWHTHMEGRYGNAACKNAYGAQTAQKLAASKQLGAELWTADQALVKTAQQIGVSWVHWMGEIE